MLRNVWLQATLDIEKETALVRVHNDIMRAFEEKKSVILFLIDSSAAFDTVDHDR